MVGVDVFPTEMFVPFYGTFVSFRGCTLKNFDLKPKGRGCQGAGWESTRFLPCEKITLNVATLSGKTLLSLLTLLVGSM